MNRIRLDVGNRRMTQAQARRLAAAGEHNPRRRLRARRWQRQLIRRGCKEPEELSQLVLGPFPMPLVEFIVTFAVDRDGRVVASRCSGCLLGKSPVAL